MRPAHVALCVAVSAMGCEGRAPSGEAWVDRSHAELPSLDVPQAAGTIVVDGRLDEAAWSSAPSTGPFVHPGSGKPAKGSRVNASAKLTYDERALYLGVRVFDAEASSPFAPSDVDPHVWSKASGIELMLQPGDFADNREYYELQVDVAGAVWDTRFDDYNRPISGTPPHQRFGHQDWQSRVERAVTRDESSYTVELALPFEALAKSRAPLPPRPGDSWRVNLYSFRDGQADALAWSPILGKGNFHKSERFGRITFR